MQAKKKPFIRFRRFFLIFNAFFFLAMVAAAAISAWSINYFRSPGPLDREVTVVIHEGSSLKSIANILAENNVIEYPEIFILIVRVSESVGRMKAGEYAFAPKVAPVTVFGKLAAGDVVVHKLTIPEGLMTVQIRDIINNAGPMTGEFPEDVKEGELLPETYDFYYGDDRAKIVRRMREAMNKTLDELWERRADNLPIKTKEEALTLASIIEKETSVNDERKRVAAVFVNRLRKNMRLQTDPSVIYAITDGKHVMDKPLIFKDLETDSPYNTYRNQGLPPGPIANPGRASIEAALNPADTNEYYFVADGTGGHKFASTLKEHNNNVRQWRKINKSK